jgi:hypothetical protein
MIPNSQPNYHCSARLARVPQSRAIAYDELYTIIRLMCENLYGPAGYIPGLSGLR